MRNILLTIVSRQYLQDQSPEETSFVTQGTLCLHEDAIEITYPETELTGLAGTTTAFRVEKDRVLLKRSGAVESKMVFAVGREDRSLYDMGFGALMITVCTERISSTLDENGGNLFVAYAITIEDEATGRIEYSIDVRLID